MAFGDPIKWNLCLKGGQPFFCLGFGKLESQEEKKPALQLKILDGGSTYYTYLPMYVPRPIPILHSSTSLTGKPGFKAGQSAQRL